MTSVSNITIRKYSPQDRVAVRRISCQTSFLGHPELFLTNQEIVADALTIYFTDYEPQSCFVAVENNVVIGYIIGSKDMERMILVFYKRILWKYIQKIFRHLDGQILKLLWAAFLSLLKGEFWAPDFHKKYPAILHINIDQNYRKLGVGARLLQSYENYLKENKIPGVRLGTMSDKAKEFFAKNGFAVLYKSRRSYLYYKLGVVAPVYVMGKTLLK